LPRLYHRGIHPGSLRDAADRPPFANPGRRPPRFARTFAEHAQIGVLCLGQIERAVAGLAFDLADEVAGGEIALQLVPIFPGDRRLPLWKEIQRDGVRVCRMKS
jgi:hypothetical protein